MREEQLVDNARTRHTHRALLLGGRMRGHDHAAGHPVGPNRNLRAIVEAAHRLARWTLLELIGRQVQTRLDERMIEHAVLFAAGDKGEARSIGEHGSGAILAIEPRASCVLAKGGGLPDTDQWS